MPLSIMSMNRWSPRWAVQRSARGSKASFPHAGRCEGRRKSSIDRAMHRAVVVHQLVSAHIDEDLSVVSAALAVALRRDDDAEARGLHADQKQVVVAEAEQCRGGRIVEIDLRRG